MKLRYRDKMARVIHQSASDLVKSGIVDAETMRQLDMSCLVPASEFRPDLVQSLRKKEKATQEALAEALGVSTQTVSQWERGVRTPDGPARKLLALAMERGLAYIR